LQRLINRKILQKNRCFSGFFVFKLDKVDKIVYNARFDLLTRGNIAPQLVGVKMTYKNFICIFSLIISIFFSSSVFADNCDFFSIYLKNQNEGVFNTTKWKGECLEEGQRIEAPHYDNSEFKNFPSKFYLADTGFIFWSNDFNFPVHVLGDHNNRNKQIYIYNGRSPEEKELGWCYYSGVDYINCQIDTALLEKEVEKNKCTFLFIDKANNSFEIDGEIELTPWKSGCFGEFEVIEFEKMSPWKFNYSIHFLYTIYEEDEVFFSNDDFSIIINLKSGESSFTDRNNKKVGRCQNYKLYSICQLNSK
jgi:hypothetical protein